MNLKTTPFVLFFQALLLNAALFAQTLSKPADYLDNINKEFKTISNDMWDYVNAASHGKKIRQVENRRKEVIKTLAGSQEKIKKMPGFQEDNAYRDSVVSYLRLCYNVMNKDYEKIINLEEVAEQSYDAMEVYLAAQDLVNEKLDAAGDRVNEARNAFAAKHHIAFTEGSNAITQKLDKADKVFKYHNTVYLVFFKSYKQEMYLLEALQAGDTAKIRQAKISLAAFNKEASLKLDTLKPFKGDASLKIACSTAIKFYTEENTKVAEMTGFFIKKSGFEKIKASFTAIPEAKRTKPDIDQYNNAVNDYNEATKKYNAANQELNAKRATALDAWNKTSTAFIDKNVPKKKT